MVIDNLVDLLSLMASSSSFAYPPDLPSRNYDVFLSFRGADTRDNFTSHLVAALKRRGIDAFIDDKLRRGNDLQKLLDIIKSSKIALIIFSENYANSDWCLEELETILECRQKNNQVVVPIFYKVRKGDVANQTGSFGIPFEYPEKFFKKEFIHRVPSWKAALKIASNIKGHVFPNTESESQLVEHIANEVLQTLSNIFPGETTHLVGIESRRKILEQMLCFRDDRKVHLVAVVGMPGIGKTAIVNDIYFQHRQKFDVDTFVAIKPGEDLGDLRKKIICDILEDENISINAAAHKFYQNQLYNKKVLIVIEDFSREQQVESLLGCPQLYRGGSRIIITTRDKNCIKNVVEADKVYEVPALNGREALQLFGRHAFPGSSKPPEEFMYLTNFILDYAKGLPLALEVLGSSLRGSEVSSWEYRLRNPESWLDEEDKKLLKISFEALNGGQKEAFLDIACFFRSENVDYVSSLLDSPGGANVIGELVDKCLITIADRRLQMHDLLHAMGKDIIIEASRKEAGKRSRLWDHEDICHVLKHKTGSENVRGIFLDTSKVRKRSLSNAAFKGMYNLRYLKVHDSHCSQGCEVDHKLRFDGRLSFLPDQLRCLHWQGYPFEEFPSEFEPENLVDLKLQFSQINKLWEDRKEARKLKWVDLYHSRNIRELSGLSMAHNLERLNLEGCTSLADLPSSISSMQNLGYLNLRECTSLTNLPDNINLKSLKTVILSSCSNLKKFPHISENIESLHLDGTAIEEVPAFITKFSKLAILNLKFCNKLKVLSEGLCNLKSLQVLILSGCSNLQRFPEINEDMECLEILLLDETGVENLPRAKRLRNLKKFSLSGRKARDSGCLSLPPLLDLSHLTELYLANTNLNTFPENVSFPSLLQCLILSGNGFQNLPECIAHLHHLRWLDLKYCKNLLSLPEVPLNLEYLDAHGCESVEYVGSPLARLTLVDRIHSMYVLTNCFKLNQKALEKIVEFALTKSKLMADSPTKHYNRVIGEPLVSISYPGTEIPSWFSHQRTGSLMEAPLLPHWCSNKFFGVALCAVVSFEGYNNNSNRFSVEATCEFKNDDGYCISFSCTLGGWRLAEIGGRGEELRKLGSDHVFLCFSSCFHIMEYHEKNKVDRCGHMVASLKFYVTDGAPNEVESCKVEKCGLSLFYAPDEEASQMREMQLTTETNQVARSSKMNTMPKSDLNHTNIPQYYEVERRVSFWH